MPAPASPGSVDGLLHLLLGGGVDASAASRHRSAALALRTALEVTVDRVLEARVPGLAAVRSMRAKMLCLRHYAEPDTAWRANAVWCHVCLACH